LYLPDSTGISLDVIQGAFEAENSAHQNSSSSRRRLEYGKYLTSNIDPKNAKHCADSAVLGAVEMFGYQI